ncbi:VanZ family protein [Agromyces ramosus]|nr:VanZ family protein [Agromyces ramosus]
MSHAPEPRPATGGALMPTPQPATRETPLAGVRNPMPALIAVFAVYLVLLAWIVLWKLDVPWIGGVQRVIKLVPFVPSGGDGASAPSEVVANLLLFVPFGVYLGLLAPSWPWWRVAGTVAGASLSLEATQYVLAIGSSDVTHLIVNAAGSLVGIGVLALARRRLQARTAAVMGRICSIGTVLAVLACGILVASQLRYGPPRELPVSSMHSVAVPDTGTPGR